jgi:hypothetical protein
MTVRVEDANSANHTAEDIPATLLLPDAITQREPHPFNLSFKYTGLIFEELSNCPKGYLQNSLYSEGH